jgi:hypothetical protein
MKRDSTARKSVSAKRRPSAPAIAVEEHVPRWVVPVVYAVAVVLLFHEFFLSGGSLLGVDTHALSYFARDFYTTFVRENGRFPLWQPYLFGGIPFVDGMHGDIFYPPSLALFFLDARTMWGWKMVLHVFLAGIFAFLWLRTIGLRRGPALFGGLVYMMGADLVSLVLPGGDGKLFVSALAPLAFLLAERAVRSGRVADFAFFGLSIALVVFTSHMQAAYFAVWGVSLWFFFRLWQMRREEGARRRIVGRLGLYTTAGVLGVAAAAVQFLPPLQYLREWSHRVDRTIQAEAGGGYEWSTSYSLHPEEIVSLAVPEFVGSDAPRASGERTPHWGRNPLKLNSEYAGLVPLLLIPLLFLRRRDPHTWFFIGLAVLSLLFALGADTPLFHLFYLIPGVSLFRAPSLIIFLYGLSVATLGAMGLQRLLDAIGPHGEGAGIRRALLIAAAVLGILALLQSAGVITNAWLSIFNVDPAAQGALQQNLPAIRNGFWIAFLVAAGVAVTWEAASVGLVGRSGVLVALCILAALDLYRADRPYIAGTVLYSETMQQNQNTLFTPDESIRFLQERRDAGEIFRAFDMAAFVGAQGYGHNDLAAHGIEQLAGHHGNEIGRYRQLIGGEGADNVLRSEFRLLDLTNTAYVLVPGRLDPQVVPGLEEVFVGSRSVVYRRTNAIPRAYLVGRFEVVSDERAVERLIAADFDARTTAVLPEPLPTTVTLEADPQGTVEWGARASDGYTLQVTTDRPALLVVSENYYPAWRVTVDDAAAPLLRANYTFRAVPVPAGSHEVHFTYRSDTLSASAGASVAVLLLLLIVAIGGTIRGRAGKGSA